MGRIANILDLPLNQKFLIASACLSVKYLSQTVAEQAGETQEFVMEQTSKLVIKHFNSEITESKINHLLTTFLENYDC